MNSIIESHIPFNFTFHESYQASYLFLIHLLLRHCNMQGFEALEVWANGCVIGATKTFAMNGTPE